MVIWLSWRLHFHRTFTINKATIIFFISTKLFSRKYKLMNRTLINIIGRLADGSRETNVRNWSSDCWLWKTCCLLRQSERGILSKKKELSSKKIRRDYYKVLVYKCTLIFATIILCLCYERTLTRSPTYASGNLWSLWILFRTSESRKLNPKQVRNLKVLNDLQFQGGEA